MRFTLTIIDSLVKGASDGAETFFQFVEFHLNLL